MRHEPRPSAAYNNGKTAKPTAPGGTSRVLQVLLGLPLLLALFALILQVRWVGA